MNDTISLIWKATLETLYMTFASSFLAYLLGIPIGIILYTTRPKGIKPMPILNNVLSVIVNFLRSIPFIILVILLIPFTRIVTGKGTGTLESLIFPLFISAFPFIARLVENSFDEIDKGIIEAAQSMGSTNMQIICKVILPESVPSLLNGAVLAITTILGYTAMASAITQNGLGSLAIIKGVSQRKYDIMYMASFMLVILVQIINFFGLSFAKMFEHRKK